MKIKRSQLKQIIKEEVKRVLWEQTSTAPVTGGEEEQKTPLPPVEQPWQVMPGYGERPPRPFGKRGRLGWGTAPWQGSPRPNRPRTGTSHTQHAGHQYRRRASGEGLPVGHRGEIVGDWEYGRMDDLSRHPRGTLHQDLSYLDYYGVPVQAGPELYDPDIPWCTGDPLTDPSICWNEDMP